MSIICPKCFADDIPDERELKFHMSNRHGGYTTEDLTKAGISPGDDAQASAREVLNSVPDPGKGRTTTKTKKQQSMEVIGRLLIRKVARMPYSMWAMFLADPRMDLTREEQQELTDMYMEIAQGLGTDFSGPKWAMVAVLLCNAEMVMRRLQLRGFVIPGFAQNDEEDPPETMQ